MGVLAKLPLFLAIPLSGQSLFLVTFLGHQKSNEEKNYKKKKEVTQKKIEAKKKKR